MIVVAGPSGSGKSTFFPVLGFGAGFNVDDHAADLHGGYAGIPPEVRKRAQLACEAFVADHIARHATFAVETTLRSRAALLQAEQARRAGFSTVLIYVCSGDAGESVHRVARRGLLGGHSASEGEIRDIYTKSLTNLASARGVFDAADLFDTSLRWHSPRRVAWLRQAQVHMAPALPEWVPESWRT